VVTSIVAVPAFATNHQAAPDDYRLCRRAITKIGMPLTTRLRFALYELRPTM